MEPSPAWAHAKVGIATQAHTTRTKLQVNRHGGPLPVRAAPPDQVMKLVSRDLDRATLGKSGLAAKPDIVPQAAE